ncbi:MAG: acyl carrier protein [Gammaproteobacteria bacterium]|nr:acyl carrier protein [Gammaproteobacteria bacterium]
MNKNETALVEFIRISLLEDPDREVATTDELLLDDIVDSLGVMRLVHFIEERGGAPVPAEDVTIDNFATIETIAGYLDRRVISLD